MQNIQLENVTQSFPAVLALIVFLLAYGLVIIEEFVQLRKSKPVVVASGILWVLVAWLATTQGNSTLAEAAVKKQLLDYVELFLFLVVAMTYINALEDRNVFQFIRAELIKKRLSYRQVFWITGFMAFFISPFADNLTTALAMSAVIIAIGKDNPRFVGLGCINLVIAANAGGAFSPFGDITTLMVWQAKLIPFTGFFKLFLPSLINYLIPAFCMHWALPKGRPTQLTENIHLGTGAKPIFGLFLLTIATSVLLHHYFHLPPVIGMMLGLGYLQMFAYYTKVNRKSYLFDIFPVLQKVEWDTLLFFYGVIMCVGALGTLGFLTKISEFLYHPWHAHFDPHIQASIANSIVGLLSALVDNIPIMFAIISMNPALSEGQWLLVTLTTGVGGSLLAIGSAAGIALLGQARGQYNFLIHLKWSPVIFLGFIASVLLHLWLNSKMF